MRLCAAGPSDSRCGAATSDVIFQKGARLWVKCESLPSVPATEAFPGRSVAVTRHWRSCLYRNKSGSLLQEQTNGACVDVWWDIPNLEGHKPTLRPTGLPHTGPPQPVGRETSPFPPPHPWVLVKPTSAVTRKHPPRTVPPPRRPASLSHAS